MQRRSTPSWSTSEALVEHRGINNRLLLALPAPRDHSMSEFFAAMFPGALARRYGGAQIGRLASNCAGAG